MVKPEITMRLLEILNISQPTLSKRAKRLKSRYGPMNTDEAVYVIAHMSGIDLSKSLPLSLQDRIRSLVPRELPTAEALTRPKVKPRKPRNEPGSYPFVTKEMVKTALHLGSEIFPYVFVLENSIRELINGRLSKTGANWWDSLAPAEVQRTVKRTILKEARYPYRRARGDHPLLYANFADLKKIIFANPTHFEDILIKQDWFSAGMDDVYMARNNLAHSIPLEQSDISHILTFSSEWAILTDKLVI